jgi:undecaprenyl-diphosphatase
VYWARRCVKVGWPLVLTLSVVSVALMVFLALAEDVYTREAFPFDASVLDFLFRLHSAPLTFIANLITTTASAPFILVATLLLGVIWWSRRRIALYAVAASVAGGVLLNELLKAIFERPRPDVQMALVHAAGYSFPSGHTTTALAFYGMLAYVLAHTLPGRARTPIYALTVIWILLVGLSRNYLGVHYPSDVIAAYAVTLPWTVAVGFVYACITGPRETPVTGNLTPSTPSPTKGGGAE